MQPNIANLDNKIERIVGRDAAESIINIADPYHDREIDFKGLPTQDQEKIVAQKIVKSYNLSAPAGTAGNWSAIIFTTPMDEVATLTASQYGSGYVKMSSVSGTDGGAALVQISNSDLMNGYQLGGSTMDAQFGPLTVHSWNTDVSEFYPAYRNGYVMPTATAALGLSNADTKYRVVGGGVEVTNTTAEIYRQGTATVCRTTNPLQLIGPHVCGRRLNGTSFLSLAGNTYNALSWLPQTPQWLGQGPPTNLAGALLVGGKQWPAAEGCYSVFVTDNDNNPFACSANLAMTFDNSHVSNRDLSNNALAINDATGFSMQTGFTSSDVVDFPCGKMLGPNHMTPRDTVAIYLTGLSAQSTFTINTTFFVELKPQPSDVQAVLVPLRKKPPAYSLKSELFSAAFMRTLPPGVMVKENPAGEFWYDLVSGIGSVASSIGGVLGGPAQAVGNVTKLASDAVLKIMDERDKKKKAASKAQANNKQNPPKKR